MNIPVVLAVEETYCVQARIVMESIMKNNTIHDLDFYVLMNKGFQSCNISLLTSVEKKYANCRVQIVDTKGKFDNAFI